MFRNLKKQKLSWILIVALGLRLISLNQSFWLDEATSALVVRQLSLTQIFTKFLPGDFHPPLYYVFLKGWSEIFGYSEIALRSMSIVFGLLTIWLVYTIGKQLFDKKVALLSSLLLAISGLHIYYSQEARMYSMQTFMVALSVYYFLRIYFSKARVAEWILFSLSLALVFLTGYLPTTIIVLFWMFSLLFKKKKEWFVKFSLSHVPFVASILIWQKHFLAQLGSGLSVSGTNSSWASLLGPTNYKNLALVYVKFIFGRISVVDKNLYTLLVGLVGLIFAIIITNPIVKAKLKPVKSYVFVWLWFLVPLFLSAIIGLKVPVLSYFRLLFILPAFYLLLAKGMSGDINHNLKYIVLGVTLVSSLVYLFVPKFHREDWRGLVQTVQETSQGPFRVVFPSFNHHEGYLVYGGPENVSGPLVLLSNYKTVWFVRYLMELYPEGDNVRKFSEEIGFEKQDELDFNGVVVWKYVRRVE